MVNIEEVMAYLTVLSCQKRLNKTMKNILNKSGVRNFSMKVKCVTAEVTHSEQQQGGEPTHRYSDAPMIIFHFVSAMCHFKTVP
jgi:hypothetical protein